MSFECDNCGKNSVGMYGQWCSECQRKEYYAAQESEARWYSESSLCQQCDNAEGPDSSDQCIEYHMPLYMVKRKRKCKHFNEWRD